MNDKKNINLEIINVTLDEIVPYANNAKLHPKEQINQIKASIQEFGFNDPIAVDENNVIIEGHGRFMAAQEMNLETVPVIKLCHMTDAQKKQYILAHNKLTMNTGFDEALLQLEMEALALECDDMKLTGFSDDELKEMLKVSVATHESELVEDDVPEIDEARAPYAQQGDVWTLGKHRLMCGDSTDLEDVRHLMNGHQARLVVTDPPYNVDYTGGTGMKIMNDSMGDSNFRAFLLDAYRCMYDSMVPGAPIYVFHADTEGHNFRSALKEAGFKLAQALVWVKNSLVLGRQDYHWRHEPILYGWKEGAAHFWYGDRDKDTVIDDDKISFSNAKKEDLIQIIKDMQAKRHAENTIIYHDKPSVNGDHPTMKPVKLVGKLLLNSSAAGDIVLDTFGGSGSTLIACEQTGRIGYTMELDPRYVDVIVKRYFKQGKEDITLEREGREYSWEELRGDLIE